MYRYQQIAFGQLASLVLNMHKFGQAHELIRQVVTRLAGAFRVPQQQVAILFRDLERRMDSERSYNSRSSTREGDTVQSAINRLIRGDVTTLRKAVAALVEASTDNNEDGTQQQNVAQSFTDDQLKAFFRDAVAKFHS